MKQALVTTYKSRLSADLFNYYGCLVIAGTRKRITAQVIDNKRHYFLETTTPCGHIEKSVTYTNFAKLKRAI